MLFTIQTSEIFFKIVRCNSDIVQGKLRHSLSVIVQECRGLATAQYMRNTIMLQ